jgi:hypothetical protein
MVTHDLASLVVARFAVAATVLSAGSAAGRDARAAWGDAYYAVRGLTDPEARTVALMTCKNAKVREATMFAVSIQEVA